MKSLNVIDLDGTLIGYDSFRVLLSKHLNVHIAVTAALRRLCILPQAVAAARFTDALAPILSDDVRVEEFARSLAEDVRADIIARVRMHTDLSTTNLLLSASPDPYVKALGKALGFAGAGSRWSGGEFLHCHATKKLRFVATHFPEKEYEYRYAVADHLSDLPLLHRFQHFELVDSETGVARDI